MTFRCGVRHKRDNTYVGVASSAIKVKVRVIQLSLNNLEEPPHFYREGF